MDDQLEKIAEFLCRMGRDPNYYQEVASDPGVALTSAGIEVDLPLDDDFELYSRDHIRTHLYSMLRNAETEKCAKWLNENDPPEAPPAPRSASKRKTGGKKGSQKKPGMPTGKVIRKSAKTRKTAKKTTRKPAKKTAKSVR